MPKTGREFCFVRRQLRIAADKKAAGLRPRLISLGRTIEKCRLADDEQPIANAIENGKAKHQTLDWFDLQARADGSVGKMEGPFLPLRPNLAPTPKEELRKRSAA
jgi:hypothetical protein